MQGVTQVGSKSLGLSGSYLSDAFTVTLDNKDDEVDIEIVTMSGQTLYIRNVEIRALTADGSNTTLD